MIKLKRDNLVMEVSTEVQASAFINNGWALVEDKKVDVVVEKPQVEKKDTNVKRKTKSNSK